MILRDFPQELRQGPPVILVTGCSSGIGLALVRRLQNLPVRVIATARATSLDKLAEFCQDDGERFLLRPLDVASAAERTTVVAEARERWGGVDVLVNNAGISARSALEEMADHDERSLLEINCLGPMALVRAVLPEMRAHRWGRIINVSSVAGMMALPTMSSYSASKWALEGASEALWYELRPWNIRVSLIQPGFVRSDSFQRVRLPGGKPTGAYGGWSENMEPFVARLMRWSRSTPDRVASRILALLARSSPPLRYAGTPDAWLFYFFRRILPRRMYHAVLWRCLPGVDWQGRFQANKESQS